MDHQTPRQQDPSIRSPPRCGASIGGGRGEGSAGKAANALTANASALSGAAAAAAVSTGAAAAGSTAAAVSTAAAGSTAAAAAAVSTAAAAVSTAAAAVSTAAAADPAMAPTASAATTVHAIASVPAASAMLTGAAAVGLAAATPTDAAPAAPDVAATSAGDRDTIQDLYSAAFTLRALSRSHRARRVPEVEHTNDATEVGGDGSYRDTTLRDEGHGSQQEGVGNNIAGKDLAVGDEGPRRRHNHHRHLSRSRSMSPSRGEKLDGRQRGAVNSRRASSLVARAFGNVVRTFAARASAADAAINDCHAPALDTAPIVAAGSSAADGDRALRKCAHGKCASPQDEGDRGIGPSATGARERLAVFPQQAIRRDLGSIFHKTGGTDFDHARSDGAIPAMSQRQAALRRPSDNLREKTR